MVDRWRQGGWTSEEALEGPAWTAQAQDQPESITPPSEAEKKKGGGGRIKCL